jgi:hypothetical protein
MIRKTAAFLVLFVCRSGISLAAAEPEYPPALKIGIIGLDTSHAISFTEILNTKNPTGELAGCRVVAAYPKGSSDIRSSVDRIPRYTEEIKSLGVEIVDSIDDLVAKSDAVLLETNDGRPHLEQVLPVLRARKRCFIDKPIAGSLIDVAAIYLAAEKFDTLVFTSSSLRYCQNVQKLRRGEYGAVLGCDTFSPCLLEPTHPDLFWYGIHGVETLFTVMQTGCVSVTRTTTADADFVVGLWRDGRIGTYRGFRGEIEEYGGTAFTANQIQPIGPYEGYRPLLVEIVKFFRTGMAPVSANESLEIYAFMEAADESKRNGGKPVCLADVLRPAKDEAAKKLARILESKTIERN